MKYLELLSKFWNSNNFDSKSTLLYLFLLHYGNEIGNQNFKLSDVFLSEKLNIKIPTIRNAREKLCNYGLIQYQTQNGTPCLYTIIEDYEVPYGDIQIKKTRKERKRLKEIVSKKILKESFQKLPKKQPDNTREEKTEIAEITFSKKSLVSQIQTNPNLPLFDEFLTFAKTLKNYSSELDIKIEDKYNIWVQNNWKNETDRPITNWKALLRNLLPYLNNSNNKERVELQNIERPKIITK